MAKKRGTRGRVRYAVVGAGHIAQIAVLPAFAHAKENSVLTAIVSGDAAKRRELGRRYAVQTFGYQQYERACCSGLFDAVYVALPNTMHRRFAETAMRAGVHVLCEKPLATTTADCEAMIAAARKHDVRLMTAYRLHFERANMEAVRLAGKVGELRLFNSVFTMQARRGNIRLSDKLGGGPLFDIGIYCINAARYLFKDNPREVVALAARGADPRFRKIDEAVSAMMRFPGERLAAFTCSFGAADAGYFQVLGTRGELKLDPAYEYQGSLELEAKVGGKVRKTKYARRDQFAPELVHFSECVLRGNEPEPSGAEGLADVATMEAINESIRSGRAVKLPRLAGGRGPSLRQEKRKKPVRKRRMVRVEPGHR